MIHVLILDDKEQFGQMLANRLRQLSVPKIEPKSVTAVHEALQMVENTDQSFDAFLIDHILGPGLDGIQAMEKLRRISPDTETIIFTGLDDPNVGLRAYQAGAYRYLNKPIDYNELVWILQSMHWLKMLTQVAEEAQGALSVRDVAKIIVKGSLKLGFERARLWMLNDSGEKLEGISEAGNEALGEFVGFQMPLVELPYSQRTLSGQEPIFFAARELGPGYLDLRFAEKGYQPPKGDWVDLPLWAANRCLGKLSLDNASHPRQIFAEQRRLLRLFGRQAAAALERARLFEQEARKSEEMEVLNQIGKRITGRAALDDLDTLLQKVRVQIGKLMDVRNFTVVLLDEETNQLDYRLFVEDNRLSERFWREAGSGLAGHLISENKALFLPQGGKAYHEDHHIPMVGEPAKCGMVVPLRVEDKAIGAIIVQCYDQEWLYSAEDYRLLAAVADQVAGAIQTVHLKELEARSSRQLEVLHHASEEIMRLAEENESWLWHAILTVATAEYALGFNRALLFLIEEGGMRLRGRMGIERSIQTVNHHDHRRGLHNTLDFDTYLEQLRMGTLPSTPAEGAVRDWVLDLSQDDGAFRQVLSHGRRKIVPGSAVSRCLPQPFVERFGATEYALTPLMAGTKVLGLVVIDNIHDRRPLRPRSLDHLESLLAQVTLIVENLRQQRAREQVIHLNYTIMAEVGNRPLKETLDQICRTAQANTGADYVAIYPLLSSTELYQIDVENVGCIGNEASLPPTSEIRQKGLTAHILRSGILTVPDVRRHRHQYEGRRLANAPILQGERIRALIGTPVRDMNTQELYGVLYLNFRTPRDFSKQDRHQAQSFASLAAIAIRNARTAQHMESIEAENVARDRELSILRSVLEEALAADQEEDRVVRALMTAAQALLDLPGVRVGLLLRKWKKMEQPDQEPHEVWHQHFLNPDGAFSFDETPDVYLGISGLAIRKGASQLVNDVATDELSDQFEDVGIGTRSELDVPIILGGDVIGIFNIESPLVSGFTTNDKRVIERLAAAAALALDNVRRQEHLRHVLSAAQAVTAPIGLEEAMDAIVDAVKEAAPDLSALTIWYKEPATGRIVPGPYFGVHHVDKIYQEGPAEGGVVRTVMQEPDPIFASKSRDEPRLARKFVQEEEIESTAAFRLQTDDEVVGAMFFNYRQPHNFTSEERTLFTILAEIVAASVRDASHLEATRKERQRLQAAVDITEAVGTTLELDQTLRSIMVKLQELFPSAMPCVLTYYATEQVLEFTPASLEFYHIDNPEYIGLTHVSIYDPGIACAVARRSLVSKQIEMINVGNVDCDERYLKLIQSTRSELCVSLMSRDRLLGVLILGDSELDAFDLDNEALIRSVAQQVKGQLSVESRTPPFNESESVFGRSAAMFGRGPRIRRNTKPKEFRKRPLMVG